MPRLRTLIVDDEPLARKVLAEELAEHPDVEVAGEAENGQAAIEQIRRLQPDLVLLDVQMPLMDGFEVIRRLEGPLPPAIIFVTAFNEYAIKAFEVGVVDYLLKPVGEERLATALQRAREAQRNPARTAESVAETLNYASSSASHGLARKFVGKRGRDFYLVDSSEILAFQAEGEIVWIFTEKTRYMAAYTLQKLEEKLRGSAFRRIHRSAIVNLDQIRKLTALSSQRWLLTLANGQQFTVSKRQARLVREVLQV